MHKIAVRGLKNSNINVFYINRRKIKKLKRKGYIFYEVRSGKHDKRITKRVYGNTYGDFYKKVPDGDYITNIKVKFVMFWTSHIEYSYLTHKEKILLFKMFNNKSELVRWKLKHD